MKKLVKYKGRRAESLSAYNDPKFVAGPYDFSKGSAVMEEKDAELICELSPIGFEDMGYVKPEPKVDPKAAAEKAKAEAEAKAAAEKAAAEKK